VQSASQDAIKSKLVAYVNGTGVAPTSENLDTAVASAVVGVVVPARISIDTTVASTTPQFEGDTGTTTTYTLTLKRSGNTDATMSLDYVVNPGAGVTASDFAGGVIPSGTVSFASGQTSATVNVLVAGDAINELDKTFNITVTDPLGQIQLVDAAGKSLSSLASSFVIQNDDPITPVITAPSAIDVVAKGTAGVAVKFALGLVTIVAKHMISSHC
jgi:hypothetical protein